MRKAAERPGDTRDALTASTRQHHRLAIPVGDPSEKLSAQLGVSVDVLVKQVPEPAWPSRVAGLRAEGAQPHEVALLHLDPVFVEQVHRLALEDIEAVLHDVRLRERDRAAWLEVDDVDVHIVTNVERVGESLRAPAPLRPWHLDAFDMNL